MDMTLGDRISILRREKGLKQDELAEKLNVSPQAVSKWENNQTCPDISLLPELSRILGISVDELLSGKQENAPLVKMLSESERKDIKDMMLRVVVTRQDGETVRINFPLAILEFAVNSGLSMTQVSGNDALKNINLNKIMEMVRQGAIGNIVEVETPDGDTVRVFVE